MVKATPTYSVLYVGQRPLTTYKLDRKLLGAVQHERLMANPDENELDVSEDGDEEELVDPHQESSHRVQIVQNASISWM